MRDIRVYILKNIGETGNRRYTITTFKDNGKEEKEKMNVEKRRRWKRLLIDRTEIMLEKGLLETRKD